MSDNKTILLENTNTIFMTNFSGDPQRDNFGSDERQVNLIIPNEEQAKALMDEGFNVKTWEKDDVITYFIKVKLNFNGKWPPKVYWVNTAKRRLLMDEESVGELDNISIKNVNAVLNPWFNSKNEKYSMYVKTMYVEQNMDDDPFAARYTMNDECEPEEGEDIPF